MTTIRLPGLVDAHVHVREPGYEHKEDLYSGTAAALAGGVTTVLDMPNTLPPTATPERLTEKARLAAAKAVCDVGLFVGATNTDLDAYLPVAQQACGLKIYVSDTFGSLRIDSLDLMHRLFRTWAEKAAAGRLSDCGQPDRHWTGGRPCRRTDALCLSQSEPPLRRAAAHRPREPAQRDRADPCGQGAGLSGDLRSHAPSPLSEHRRSAPARQPGRHASAPGLARRCGRALGQPGRPSTSSPPITLPTRWRKRRWRRRRPVCPASRPCCRCCSPRCATGC